MMTDWLNDRSLAITASLAAAPPMVLRLPNSARLGALSKARIKCAVAWSLHPAFVVA
jgi:hypothetical protein